MLPVVPKVVFLLLYCYQPYKHSLATSTVLPIRKKNAAVRFPVVFSSQYYQTLNKFFILLQCYHVISIKLLSYQHCISILQRSSSQNQCYQHPAPAMLLTQKTLFSNTCYVTVISNTSSYKCTTSNNFNVFFSAFAVFLSPLASSSSNGANTKNPVCSSAVLPTH